MMNSISSLAWRFSADRMVADYVRTRLPARGRRHELRHERPLRDLRSHISNDVPRGLCFVRRLAKQLRAVAAQPLLNLLMERRRRLAEVYARCACAVRCRWPLMSEFCKLSAQARI